MASSLEGNSTFVSPIHIFPVPFILTSQSNTSACLHSGTSSLNSCHCLEEVAERV